MQIKAFGLTFPNPVGLAAGKDKDAVAIPAWAGLGFGFVEVGTVTRYPQPGNPAPRLFRLVESEAIVNRMGFNNRGAAAMAVRLDRLGPRPIPVGISLGKSKITPVEDATADYLHSLEPSCCPGTRTTSRSTSARRTRRGCARCRTAGRSTNC